MDDDDDDDGDGDGDDDGNGGDDDDDGDDDETSKTSLINKELWHTFCIQIPSLDIERDCGVIVFMRSEEHHMMTPG